MSHLPQGLVFGLFPTNSSHFRITSEETDVKLSVTGDYKHVHKAFDFICVRNSNIMTVLFAKRTFTDWQLAVTGNVKCHMYCRQYYTITMLKVLLRGYF